MATCRSPPPSGRHRETDQDPRPRPMWQRILLPVLGLLCLALATLGGFLPFLPGWPLALIGLPLLAAFNPRWEAWIRRHRKRLMDAVATWCRRRWRRLKRGLPPWRHHHHHPSSTRLPRHHEEPS